MSFAKLADEMAALAAASGTPADGAGDGGTPSDEALVKSFSFTLEDGTQVDAVDGAEMLKALEMRIEKDGKELGEVLGSMTTMLKSMSAQIAALSGKGAGRKAVLAMPADTGAAAGTTEPAKPDLSLVMAKAESAFNEGRITGLTLGTMESMANRGILPPVDMLRAIA